MKKPFKIDVEGLLEFQETESVLYASSCGLGSSKKLKISLKGIFKVYLFDNLILETESPELAVETFNKLK